MRNRMDKLVIEGSVTNVIFETVTLQIHSFLLKWSRGTPAPCESSELIQGAMVFLGIASLRPNFLLRDEWVQFEDGWRFAASVTPATNMM